MLDLTPETVIETLKELLKTYDGCADEYLENIAKGTVFSGLMSPDLAAAVLRARKAVAEAGQS